MNSLPSFTNFCTLFDKFKQQADRGRVLPRKLPPITAALDQLAANACENHRYKCEKMQKMWTLYLSEIEKYGSGSELLEKIQAVALKIIHSPQPPSVRTLSVLDAIEDHNLIKYLISSLLEPTRELALRTYRYSFNQTGLALRRILKGEYGSNFRDQILNDPNKYVSCKDQFFKIVLIDMLTRGIDPKEQTEWFRSAAPKELDLLIEKYKSLSPEERTVFSRNLLLAPESMPSDIEKSLNAIISDCHISNHKYKYILNYIRLYLKPTSMQLSSIALGITQTYTAPSSAIKIARTMRNDHRRTHAVCQIIEIEALKNPLNAFGLLQSLSDDQALYKHAFTHMFVSIARHGKTGVTKQASDLIKEHQDIHSYRDLIETTAHEIVKQPLHKKGLPLLCSFLTENNAQTLSTQYITCCFGLSQTIENAIEASLDFANERGDDRAHIQTVIEAMIKNYVTHFSLDRFHPVITEILQYLSADRRESHLKTFARQLCSKATDNSASSCADYARIVLQCLENKTEHSQFLIDCAINLAEHDIKEATKLMELIENESDKSMVLETISLKAQEVQR